MNDERVYQIGLTLIDGVGDVIAKKLIAHCGGAEAVFHEHKAALQAIPGIRAGIVNSILSKKVLERAEEELAFIQKQDIEPLFYQDEAYPHRLRFCEDGPLMLYTKGQMNLNAKRIVAVVGTRKATDYGKETTQRLVEELVPYNALVLSGLAYGVDVYAHRKAMEVELQTVGVMAHGLDRVYPHAHRHIARQMETNGGVITEFLSGTIPDRENFPRRNRIVAGMADAVIVVESYEKGGALITANIAFSYGRDVFAVPGLAKREPSAGCHKLIRTNKAALIESGTDLEYFLGWAKEEIQQPETSPTLDGLSGQERKLVEALRQYGKLGIDRLSAEAGVPMHEAASSLLNLEFSSYIRVLPGKVYALA